MNNVRCIRRKCWSSLSFLAIMLAVISVAAVGQTDVPGFHGPGWPQWALNPQHTEFDGAVRGQELNRNIVNLIYDFNVAAEQADPNAAGTLLVHYQVPLVDGNDVFFESKDGTYSNDTYSTQRWHQNKYTWQNGTLVKVWTFDTDWFA